MKEAEKKDKKAVEQDEVETLKKDEDLQNELNEEEIREKEVSETCEKEEKTLEEELECLKKENADLKDQYLRKLAEFDNYRKRMIKEKQEAIDYANTNLLLDLLTTLDDFDRAIQAASQNSGEEKKGDKKQAEASILEGLCLMNKQMLSMLENKYNLLPFGKAGEAYDHDRHEAIGSMQMPVAEPVLAEVYLKGYLLKDRVIRPAKVMVHMPDGTETEK